MAVPLISLSFLTSHHSPELPVFGASSLDVGGPLGTVSGDSKSVPSRSTIYFVYLYQTNDNARSHPNDK